MQRLSLKIRIIEIIINENLNSVLYLYCKAQINSSINPTKLEPWRTRQRFKESYALLAIATLSLFQSRYSCCYHTEGKSKDFDEGSAMMADLLDHEAADRLVEALVYSKVYLKSVAYYCRYLRSIELSHSSQPLGSINC